jgi:hypothetical protein
MAIFGHNDRDLPILTTFYQVRRPDGWKDNPDVLLGSEMEQWYDFVRQTIARKQNEEAQKKLAVLAAIHEWAVPLMDGIVAGEIPADAMAQAAQAAQEYIVPQYFVRAALRSEEERQRLRRAGYTKEFLDRHDSSTSSVAVYIREDAPIPVGSLVFEMNPDREEKASPGQIVQEMHNLLLNPSRAAVCDTCGSVYVRRRGLQIRCSWRCTNRVRVRRQRKTQIVQ